MIEDLGHLANFLFSAIWQAPLRPHPRYDTCSNIHRLPFRAEELQSHAGRHESPDASLGGR